MYLQPHSKEILLLSYRHSYHAGNHADVLKHIVLVEILEHLTKKNKPFDYIDTHAGAGLYNLQNTHATKLKEYEGGIAKLKPAEWPELQKYLSIVEQYNPHSALQYYPGSPLFALNYMRGKDRIWLYELHPNDYLLLENNTAKMKSVRVMQTDGFKGLLSLLPPASKRALVLIDPSYEIKTDYQLVVDTLISAYKKFPTAVYALWYPVVDRKQIDALQRGFIRSGMKNVQQYELAIATDQYGTGMSASGMIVINPPWTLMDKLQLVLPKLVEQLGGEGAFFKNDQLVGE